MKTTITKKMEKEKRSQIIEAIRLLSHEKGIEEMDMIATIQRALEAAYRKNTGEEELPKNYRADINMMTGDIKIFVNKTVVAEVTDPLNQISLEEAVKIKPYYLEGDIVDVDVTPSSFLRTAAQTAKQVITQKLRETENGRITQEYTEKENDILTAIVQSEDSNGYVLELGSVRGILERSECVPGEDLQIDDHIKVYLLNVNRYSKGDNKYAPTVRVSRSHAGLIKRLFENEVPEIATGVVQIKEIAREAGSRTKIAVTSIDPVVDPVGSCVGPRGSRVDSIVKEIRNEKIDIIKWSENPAEFIANALNPAHVLSVYIAENENACRVVVPDSQLSLAIGKEGQNARLAARLTGWRIDIKSLSQAMELNDMVGAIPVEFNYQSEEDVVEETGTTSFIMDAYDIPDFDEDEDITL
ncbi:MAG: transcription termination factor NusA [Eubacteriales bacterium]|nr:transcription termination factor NusA [Eubacteriales bacterium]